MLRGRIDRIDHDIARDEWHVWDYKSGSTYQFDQGGQLQCGMKIQHAIYARAVEAVFGGRVTRSGYYFPTPRGAGARMPRQCGDQDLRDALNLLFDTIRTGWFPHGTEEACTFCDFHDVCGERVFSRTERKLTANPSHPAVVAWCRLQEVK
jgi:ATP-dependent helicase/nuclease subunit B